MFFDEIEICFFVFYGNGYYIFEFVEFMFVVEGLFFIIEFIDIVKLLLFVDYVFEIFLLIEYFLYFCLLFWVFCVVLSVDLMCDFDSFYMVWCWYIVNCVLNVFLINCNLKGVYVLVSIFEFNIVYVIC